MQFDWKSYFIFTIKEQKGILVLGCILSFSLLLHYLLPSKQIDNAHTQSLLVKPIVLFFFDPNFLDSAGGYQLGLSRRQMTTLYHYREKGGKFYKKEDLLKWYGLSESQAKQLIPWVQIKGQDSGDRSKWYKKPYGEKEQQIRIDINNTNESEWVRITGLPAYKVKRILTYQKWTGGYKSITGLKKVYGITSFDFEMIRPFLMYHPVVSKKMLYQTMRFEDWMSLGIFDEKTVWSIMKLRKKREGTLSWAELVIQFDLTESEASELKRRTNLSN